MQGIRMHPLVNFCRQIWTKFEQIWVNLGEIWENLGKIWINWVIFVYNFIRFGQKLKSCIPKNI